MKDSESETLVRVGLCPQCFEGKSELCLDTLKTRMVWSEEEFSKDKKIPSASLEILKEAYFVGVKGYEEYWQDIKQNFPNGAKTTSEFLGVVENAR